MIAKGLKMDGLPVGDEMHVGHFTELLKRSADRFRRGVKSQIADVETITHDD
jgi:hypothetical protein